MQHNDKAIYMATHFFGTRPLCYSYSWYTYFSWNPSIWRVTFVNRHTRKKKIGGWNSASEFYTHIPWSTSFGYKMRKKLNRIRIISQFFHILVYDFRSSEYIFEWLVSNMKCRMLSTDPYTFWIVSTSYNLRFNSMLHRHVILRTYWLIC